MVIATGEHRRQQLRSKSSKKSNEIKRYIVAVVNDEHRKINLKK